MAAVALIALVGAGTAEAKKKKRVVTKTFSSGDLAVPIADAPNAFQTADTFVPMNISRRGIVMDIDVSVRVEHAGLRFLFVDLLAPDPPDESDAQMPMYDGARIEQPGSLGTGLGTGPNSCSGTPTVFNESAPIAIDSAPPPFIGSWKTTQLPFTGLDRLNGGSLKGRWQLLLSDAFPNSAGTLGCWSLKIKYKKPKPKKKKKKKKAGRRG
jgi:subtilisin-like proprotein convertase family protein